MVIENLLCATTVQAVGETKPQFVAWLQSRGRDTECRMEDSVQAGGRLCPRDREGLLGEGVHAEAGRAGMSQPEERGRGRDESGKAFMGGGTSAGTGWAAGE